MVASATSPSCFLFVISEIRCNIKKQWLGVFNKIGSLENFAIFTGKHLCRSLFFSKVAGLPEPHFNKVEGLQPATLLKKKPRQATNFTEKEIPAQVFSCEFCEIFKNIFFIELLRATASQFRFKVQIANITSFRLLKKLQVK